MSTFYTDNERQSLRRVGGGSDGAGPDTPHSEASSPATPTLLSDYGSTRNLIDNDQVSEGSISSVVKIDTAAHGKMNRGKLVKLRSRYT